MLRNLRNQVVDAENKANNLRMIRAGYLLAMTTKLGLEDSYDFDEDEMCFVLSPKSETPSEEQPSLFPE